MNLAVIELKYSPPIYWLDRLPGLRHDPGGYCYRIRYPDGRLRICGTVQTLEETRAKKRAVHSARNAGFTHYRMIDSDHVHELPPSA